MLLLRWSGLHCWCYCAGLACTVVLLLRWSGQYCCVVIALVWPVLLCCYWAGLACTVDVIALVWPVLLMLLRWSGLYCCVVIALVWPVLFCVRVPIFFLWIVILKRSTKGQQHKLYTCMEWYRNVWTEQVCWVNWTSYKGIILKFIFFNVVWGCAVELCGSWWVPRMRQVPCSVLLPQKGSSGFSRGFPPSALSARLYIQGPPKKCKHTLTKENSTLYNRLL